MDIGFETATEYIMTKNKELYQRFSPDWTSPVGDTIKDILEERGENYDDFIFTVADRTGWGDYPLTIKDIFEGKEEMYFDVANYLSEKLGSTPEFWMKRSQPINQEPDPIDRVLEKIISNCLSAQIKAGDTPGSASTHLNSAIAALSELIPGYNPDDEEMRAALEWAIDEGKILRGELL